MEPHQQLSIADAKYANKGNDAQVFRDIKVRFGYAINRYRDLAKNAAGLTFLTAIAEGVQTMDGVGNALQGTARLEEVLRVTTQT